jgi:hypothetical protein
LIVAGSKRGVISDPEVVGLEYDLTDQDRDYLEPVGHNLIVKRRGFGILLFSNNTAYQRINSALNNTHVRDNLSTIERDIERERDNIGRLPDKNRLEEESIVSQFAIQEEAI